MISHSRWLSAGLFCTTLSTLVLEILDARLLSVVTWYHLSFLAVSLAMLGMAAGAVLVFLGGPAYRAGQAPRMLALWSGAFAVLLPFCHIVNLSIPLTAVDSITAVATVPLVISTVVLGLPFFASGVVVTLVLTRVPGQIGRLYAWDLLGAAAGCISVVALLEIFNLSSVALLAGAIAAAGAWCFQRFAGTRRPWGTFALAVLLILAAVINGTHYGGVGVRFAKDRWLPPSEQMQRTAWNSYSFVMVDKPGPSPYFYWGAGAQARTDDVSTAWILIDGEAGTPVTKWDGNVADLDWVGHDVTAAAYAIRSGDVAIIGVGGGRDILSALAAGNTRVTGIEMNGILLDTLTSTYREFANIATHRGVKMVHDEARSFLSRSPVNDVVQMSLIDTWAATGAGAFTLSENGLYTVDAWRQFLNSLRPQGVFAVSRWFSPGRISETTRLLALGIAAILDRGGDPTRQLVLLSRGPVATLIASNEPFTGVDRDRLLAHAQEDAFSVLVSPWTPPADLRFAKAIASRTRAELNAAVADPDLDFSPPDDDRPYFFNLLKLRSFIKVRQLMGEQSGVVVGNLVATTSLVILFGTASVLVAAIVIGPLLIAGAGAHQMPRFGSAVAYFALIGAGYMLVQIAFLQRFSVFLGHPVYTFSVILMSMISLTGVGSFLSDGIALGTSSPARWLPLAVAMTIGLETLLMPSAIRFGISLPLAGRTAVVLAFTAPISLMLGCCFPLGMRLIGRLTDVGAAWMWGVNGACGVLASVAAVAISMWLGISSNLILAATCYLVVTLPMRILLAENIQAFDRTQDQHV